MAALLGLVFGNTAAAQDIETIDWTKYAVTVDDAISETEGVYICYSSNPGEDGATYQFVNASEWYGVSAVLMEQGLIFNVKKSDYDNSKYIFTAATDNPNQGSCLGVNALNDNNYVFIDRDESDKNGESPQNVRWTLSSSNSNSNHYTFSINCYKGRSSTTRYLKVSNSKLSVSQYSSDVFLLIPVDKFRTAIKDVKDQTLVNVSGLIQNSVFIRNATAVWNWYKYDNGITDEEIAATDDDVTDEGIDNPVGRKSYGAYISIHPHMGSSCCDSYASTYGAFGAVEMKQPIVLKQTITGLNPGTYIVKAQGFISNDADVTPAETSDAYLFAQNGSDDPNTVDANILSTDEQTLYTEKYRTNTYKDLPTSTSTDHTSYYRHNVAAALFLASAGAESPVDYSSFASFSTTYKEIEVAVTVTADEGKTGSLTIGMAKTSDGGRAYFDNIELWYEGHYEFGINAYNTESTELSDKNATGIDVDSYKYGHQFNLARDFGITDDNSTAKWEALVLPVNVTVSQLRNTFGDDVKLSKLQGLDDDGSCIIFNPVDLTTGADVAITAGECYIIKVTAKPNCKNRGESYSFYRNMKEETHETAQTYSGPIYQISNVSRVSALSDLMTENGLTYTEGYVTKDYTTTGGTLKYTGYFYRPDYAPQKAYVVSAGKMYHLTSNWSKFMGTMWYLEDPTSLQITSMSVNGDSGTTGITSVEENVSVADGKIYDLQGRRVNNPVHGIYIMNGKKYIVK